MNNESVGKKIVEALKKQAESIDIAESVDSSLFEEPATETETVEISNNDFFAEPSNDTNISFFEDFEEEKEISLSDEAEETAKEIEEIEANEVKQPEPIKSDELVSFADDFEEVAETEELITVRPIKFQQFEQTPPIRTIKKNLDIL